MHLIGVNDPDRPTDVIPHFDSNMAQTDGHGLCCLGVRTSYGFISQRLEKIPV